MSIPVESDLFLFQQVRRFGSKPPPSTRSKRHWRIQINMTVLNAVMSCLAAHWYLFATIPCLWKRKKKKKKKEAKLLFGLNMCVCMCVFSFLCDWLVQNSLWAATTIITATYIPSDLVDESHLFFFFFSLYMWTGLASGAVLAKHC